MEIYIKYLSQLASGIDSIIAMVGWSLLGVFFSWLSGLWLAIMCSSKGFSENQNQLYSNWVWLHPVAIAAGLAMQICLWTASLYITGKAWPGALALIVPVFFSVLLLRRFWAHINWSGYGIFVIIGGIAFIMGLWHHAATELLSVVQGTEQIVFSDLQQDLSVHVYMAGLVKETGLPIINPWASGYVYGAQTHTGHAVLIAGYSEVFGISLYVASTVVWIITILLTGWGVLALVSRENGCGTAFKLAVVIGIFAWGQFSLTNIGWPLGPLNPEFNAAPGSWTAARSYWNISQSISIAITCGGLLVLDLYNERRRAGLMQPLILAAAVGLITIAGWTKPSLVVFYGPALIIWLALSNARIAEFATTLIVIALGVLIYLIPSFFHELGPSSTWSLAADRRQFFTVLLFLWNSSAGLVIVSLAVIVRSVTTGWKDRQFRLFDLCIVAFGGSILFALIFREDHFVGFRTFQPNIWWGLSACVLLLVPVVARRVTELLKNGVWYRWVTIAAIAIASIQIINGFSIAIAYPVLYLRHYSPLAIKTLDMARSKTGAYARFAIDPILENVDLRPYLSRPSIIRLSFSYQDDKKNYAAWSDFCNKVVDAPPVDIIDAAILHKGRSHANRYFEMSAWQATPLDEFFILWLNPKYLMNRDIENIEASLQQGRDDPELFHKLGLLYEKKGDIPMAQKNYKKILQLKPDYAPALIQSAVLSFNQNDYGEALTLLKHAVEIQPENAKLYYCIACVYSRQNQHDPAIEWLKKAVDKGYGNWDLLANDKDLDNIRHLPGYKELVKDKLH